MAAFVGLHSPDEAITEDLYFATMDTDPIVHMLQPDHFLQLETLFKQFSENSEGYINIHHFQKALNTILPNAGYREIKRLFEKIDATDRGRISWAEFILQCEAMAETKLISDYYTISKTKCFDHFPSRIFQCVSSTDEMTAMFHYPEAYCSPVDRISGCYVAASRHGFLFWWSSDLKKRTKRHIWKHLKNIDVPQPKKCAINAMAFVQARRLLVVSNFVGSVGIYNSDPEDLFQLTSFDDFPFRVVSLDYHLASESKRCDTLICAETKGGLSVITIDPLFFDDLRLDNLSRIKTLPPVKRLSYKGLKGACNKAVRLLRLEFEKCGLVIQAKFIEALSSVVANTSDFGNLHLMVYNLEKSVVSRVKDRRITCFEFLNNDREYCSALITGGTDGLVKAWMPEHFNKPLFSLDGGTGAVTHVAVDSIRILVITITKTWTVSVWDYLTKHCRQLINLKGGPLGTTYPNILFYDEEKQRMFIHGRKCLVFDGIYQRECNTHKGMVSCVFYSHAFDCIITAGHESRVSTWNAKDGCKLAEIFPGHTISYGEEEYLTPIVDLKLDPYGRRVAIVFRNGIVKVFCVHTAVCLKQYFLSMSSITCVVFANNSNLCVGDGSDGILWLSYVADEKPTISHLRNDQAVVCMDIYRKSIIATASHQGEIFIWTTGQPRYSFFDRGSEFKEFVLKKKERATTVPVHIPPQKWIELIEKRKLFFDLIMDYERARCGETQEQRVDSGPLNSFLTRYFEVKSKKERSPEEYEELLWGGFDELHIAAKQIVKQPELMESFWFEERVQPSKDKAAPRLRDRAHMNCRITKLMFLQKRNIAANIGVLMTCGKDAYVRFWSINIQSGLLARFRIHSPAYGSITSITIDDENKYLIAGNETGHISVMDIENYCNGEETMVSMNILREKHIARFPYLRLQKRLEGTKYCKMFYPENCDSQDSEKLLTTPPFLMNCFRAHCSAVTSLEFVSSKELILSGGLDGSVRVWHITGYHVGMLGQPEPYSILLSSFSFHGEKNHIPPDVRTMASPTSLKVLNKGRCPMWERALASYRDKKRRFGHLPRWAMQFATEETLSLRKAYEERKKTASPILQKFYKIEDISQPIKRTKKKGFEGHIYAKLDLGTLDEIDFNALSIKDSKSRVPHVESDIALSLPLEGRWKAELEEQLEKNPEPLSLQCMINTCNQVKKGSIPVLMRNVQRSFTLTEKEKELYELSKKETEDTFDPEYYKGIQSSKSASAKGHLPPISPLITNEATKEGDPKHPHSSKALEDFFLSANDYSQMLGGSPHLEIDNSIMKYKDIKTIADYNYLLREFIRETGLSAYAFKSAEFQEKTEEASHGETSAETSSPSALKPD